MNEEMNENGEREFTLVRFEDEFYETTPSRLSQGLSVPVYQQPEFPMLLILEGKFTPAIVKELVSDDGISVEVVKGLDNLRMPFRPPEFKRA